MPSADGGSPAPIDRPILEYIRDRVATASQVTSAGLTSATGGLELRIELADAYYPPNVSDATLSVRWYTNDDFAIHYRETHDGGTWECRWDRHPNPHNTREHFHPPPDAATPGRDETWPIDYRDVVRQVFAAIENRIADIWNE